MKKIAALLLISSLAFTACRKEVTEVQQVDQAFSTVLTIAPGDWSTSDNGYTYSAFIDIPDLDNTIYDHGAVLVYLEITSGIYEALPEVFGGVAYGAIHNAGHITIDISDALGEAQVDPPSQSIKAKIVLIDAQLLSLHPDVNLKDLNAVQKTFKVK